MFPVAAANLVVLSLATMALGGCGTSETKASISCDDFATPAGFWQKATDPPAVSVIEHQVDRTLKCGDLKGKTEAEVVRALGKPIGMHTLGTTDAEAFRVWSLGVGPGLYVEFDVPGRTVNSVTEYRAEDGDIWR